MIAFTCSGTGGHIYPALAMAQYLDEPEMLFIIEKDRIAAEIIPKYHYNCCYFKFSKKNIVSFIKAIIGTRKIMKEKKVTRLMSTGGYATVPVVLAAFTLRIRIVLHEQNTVPGRANRFLSFFAKKICISFNYSRRYFKNHPNVALTGNPIRTKYPSDERCMKIVNSQWAKGKRLLVFGGSQGAHAINEFIQKNHSFFKQESVNVLHITGATFFQSVYKQKEPVIVTNDQKEVIQVTIDYIENMKAVYEWCDIVISRAGATSIAELSYYNKPALLIPFPYATDNHQEINAQELVANNQAIMSKQANLSRDTLYDLLKMNQSIIEKSYVVNYERLFWE